MARIEIPLVGLLEESIFPAEERTFTAPVLDANALAALGKLAARPDAGPPLPEA